MQPCGQSIGSEHVESSGSKSGTLNVPVEDNRDTGESTEGQKMSLELIT